MIERPNRRVWVTTDSDFDGLAHVIGLEPVIRASVAYLL